MKKKVLLAATYGLWQMAGVHADPLTPEQRGDPSTGKITTDAYGQPLTDGISVQYYGSSDPRSGEVDLALSNSKSIQGTMTGAYYPSKASVTWYKFSSDGVSPLTINMFGGLFGLNLGGSFGSKDDGSIAVFNNQGQFVASNQGAVAPVGGDSYVTPTVSGNPPAGAVHNDREPFDPTQPVAYTYSSGAFYASNSQGFPILNFVAHPQASPTAASNSSSYSWNQYPLLPAGNYYLAVTGYSTYYSGSPKDSAAIDQYHSQGYGGNTVSTTPFGFITFQANSGTYQINTLVTGDMDLNGSDSSNDLRLLRLQVGQYNSSAGIPAAGFYNSDPSQGWNGLPSDLANPVTDLQRYDLTGNSRIDSYDITLWGSMTNSSTQVSLTWNNIKAANDTLNIGSAGDGTTWDVKSSQNFNDPTGIEIYIDGDGVTFNDSNNGHYNVALNSVVQPGSLTVANSTGNYVISGTGSINGSTGLLKSGTGKLTLSTSNAYTGGTNVSAGTLALTVTGALPSNSALTIGSGASVLAVNHGSSPKVVLETSSLTIAGSTNAWTGKLDLANNDLVAHAASLQQLTNQVKTGFGSSLNWQGSGGVTSSSAAADSKHLTALGVIQNSVNGSSSGTALYSSFDGVAVSNTDVLVKYTYYGDSNLDGKVDASDYSKIDSGFLTHASGWFNGDFNYDGLINGSDYTLIDNAFDTQGANLTAVVASSTAEIASPTSVPEPGFMAISLVPALGLLRRRKI